MFTAFFRLTQNIPVFFCKKRVLTQYLGGSMKLQNFLSIFQQKNLFSEKLGNDADLEIKSIGCDSRFVTPGQLFFVKGVHFKPEYLQQAEKNGAVALVCQQKQNSNLPQIIVTDIRKAMPLAANIFYQNPSAKYQLVGITGTKGKTTCAYMLKSIFDKAFGKNKTGLISTTEAICGERKLEKTGTTPEALELFGILNQFARQKIKAACMEVSSQGLQYHRVDEVDFDTGIFLNLGSDHISPTEHKSFEEYKQAKKQLFSLCQNAVINIDDPYGEEFLQSARCEKKYTISIRQPADFYAKNILLSKNGSSFELAGPYLNNVFIELRIAGEFNIYNSLSAIAAAFLAGCDLQSIQDGLLDTVIAGRMQIYEKNGITVVVDYAHNELSFEAVFRHLKKFYPTSRIVCLFACQGNKAYDRRTELPQVVGKYADFAVITSDDPENEEPQAIIDEVEAELKKTGIPYTRIEDREQAVHYAVTHARKGDVVLLAGKGQETTQKVRGGTVFYKGDLPSAIEALK